MRFRYDARSRGQRGQACRESAFRPGRPDVYVVDPAGYRRRVANHSTYDRLFRDWRGIVDATDLEEMAERPPLTSASLLVRGDASALIYLLDEGRKRLIPNDAVMNKY